MTGGGEAFWVRGREGPGHTGLCKHSKELEHYFTTLEVLKYKNIMVLCFQNITWAAVQRKKSQ